MSRSFSLFHHPTQQLEDVKFFLVVLMTLIASIITFSKKKKFWKKKCYPRPSTWYPRPRHGTLDPRPSTKRQTQFHLYFAQTKWNTIAWKMTFRKTNLIDNRPSWHLPSSSACQVWFSGGSDWYRQLVSALKADVGASLIYFSPREYCEPRNAWQTSPKGRLRGG